MAPVSSRSHHVFVSSDVVVKLIEAERHSRLDREVALAPDLPFGLTPPLLASGSWPVGVGDVRYACYRRAQGSSPGMCLPGIDELTACKLAELALQQLNRMHGWIPVAEADQTLREPLDHGGFVGRAALMARLECLADRDRNGIVAGHLLEGVATIAERAPLRAAATVPVHADCHWGNWLASKGKVTALLDFEWARFGEPADDWFFLLRFSGPHMEAVLDVVSSETGFAKEPLRAECEIRDAAHLVSDLCTSVERGDTSSPMVDDRLRGLEELIVERYWWRQSG
jgi:Phosphotransferase enzyme family